MDKTSLCFVGDGGEGVTGPEENAVFIGGKCGLQSPLFSLPLRLIVTNRQGPWCGHVALTAHCQAFPRSLKGTFSLLPLNDIDRNKCCFFNECIIFKLDFFGNCIMKVPAWHHGSILVSAMVTGKSLIKFQPSAVRISLEGFYFLLKKKNPQLSPSCFFSLLSV